MRHKKLSFQQIMSPRKAEVEKRKTEDEESGAEDLGGDNSDVEKKKKKPESFSGATTPDEDRLRLLGALIFANLGGNPTIDEDTPGSLTISYTEGVKWTLNFSKGRATLEGFPNSPNLEQFMGNIDEERPEADLIMIAENTSDMIQEAMEQNQAGEEPIHFQGTTVETKPILEQTLEPAPGTELPPMPPGGDMPITPDQAAGMPVPEMPLPPPGGPQLTTGLTNLTPPPVGVPPVSAPPTMPMANKKKIK